MIRAAFFAIAILWSGNVFAQSLDASAKKYCSRNATIEPSICDLLQRVMQARETSIVPQITSVRTKESSKTDNDPPVLNARWGVWSKLVGRTWFHKGSLLAPARLIEVRWKTPGLELEATTHFEQVPNTAQVEPIKMRIALLVSNTIAFTELDRALAITAEGEFLNVSIQRNVWSIFQLIPLETDAFEWRVSQLKDGKLKRIDSAQFIPYTTYLAQEQARRASGGGFVTFLTAAMTGATQALEEVRSERQDADARQREMLSSISATRNRTDPTLHSRTDQSGQSSAAGPSTQSVQQGRQPTASLTLTPAAPTAAEPPATARPASLAPAQPVRFLYCVAYATGAKVSFYSPAFRQRRTDANDRDIAARFRASLPDSRPIRDSFCTMGNTLAEAEQSRSSLLARDQRLPGSTIIDVDFSY